LAVTGIGNALLDITTVDHAEAYTQHGFAKGAMNLIEREMLEPVYASMGPTVEMSGGSVANTIAGVAALGGTCGFIGKIGSDAFGDRFTHDLTTLGAEVDLARASADEGETGRCHVFVTDDAQRTMATYLGVANQLGPDDVREDLVKRSEITYIEGYLFDTPPAKAAIRKITEFAHEHDSMVALSLSDSFCVDRHRADFLELITNDVDVLLVNELEILALFQTTDHDVAYGALEELGILAAVTKGPDGVDVVTFGGVVSIPAPVVETVVDQNGAGDMFAAGFLYGLALGCDPVEAAHLGNLCAGEVITHLGARPEANLEALAIEAELL
jgi:sugar/nucleoside kinase (ribokinase family)